MADLKTFERYSVSSLSKGTDQDPKGRIFKTPRITWDLSHILICGTFVDTVRQNYHGQLKPDLYRAVKEAAEGTGEFRFLEGQHPWAARRMGKVCGYRYALQDNTRGVILLIGSYYQAEADLLEGKPGHHLKIELSPHLLAACNVHAIQTELDSFAHHLMTAPEPAGVAIHLAVDVQHWSPDPHFQDRFITRARIARRYDGISDAEFEGLSDVSVCYGKQAAESLTFGKAASLQLCLYDKSKQIVHADKVDFMQGQWGEFTEGEFDPTQPVWRVEARFHHSVVNEIGEGLGKTLKRWLDVVPHLTDMWRYALTINRAKDGTYIDPIWQLLRDDPEFRVPAQGYKIVRKKKEDVSAVARNFGNVLGNLISLYAREGRNADYILIQIKRLSIYPKLLEHLARRGQAKDQVEQDLMDFIREGLWKRRTLGRAA
ncbi:hypothetical protein [Methylococcus mesophilus]|uniref:hypothetical protein n=1 Tax=Methylococcus mesophilus TaxID=2993564 RepID=UPI00224B4BEB|nr:hypothetical protein [Methylococcus mesophilus]UZR30215.1 hypothetical protein OOT43_06115 [Methylococcus mesophilus]